MTFKQLINPRNFMIILCIFVLVLLGEKALLISDKINAVQEADRLYAAGDLIAAEEQYQEAAANSSIQYMDEEISARLKKLTPITLIRNGLEELDLSSQAQAATKDFAGLMKSYESLIRLKANYMKPGSPYETYYRQLSANSGISDRIASYFQQFKKQFYEELTQSKAILESTDDSFKWNLLLIPDPYFGGSKLKQQQLASRFEAYDKGKLSALAAAGQLESLLNNAQTQMNSYKLHQYEAPWVLEQTEKSGQQILSKDVEGNNITAFTEHALLYRKFADAADLSSSKVIHFVDNSLSKLLKSAGRMVRAGQFTEAIQLYGQLDPLQDTSAEITAALLSWNIAEPVRLLPGGEEAERYSHVISGKKRYDAQVYVAGTDSTGRLYYAAMKNDNSVVSITGDIIPGYESLRSLTFNEALSSSSGLPVVLAEANGEGGRSDFYAYEMRPDGLSILFTLRGDSYELQPDGSIILNNADIGDGVEGQKALYRIVDGVYQFAEIVQEYPLISAVDLELHPYENVSLSVEIYLDINGNTFTYADGRYISLLGDINVTGNTMVTGQFQNGYETVMTDVGEQNVPVFIVNSLGSLSLQEP
ncbi:hypothetical protein [Paenibacillus wynnii]|uniref:Uncharacterized protein n=1 Tax=Paenibacillus wynnii TaxID=268407 RepID=A0A098MB23_9BACL|nr:hypothetical protein [Paenibacillus wynnii]KGE19266.1 hypothetical protein PWYN_07810 [Paenibacillus wynnii]